MVDKKDWLLNRTEEVSLEVLGKELYELGPHLQLMCYMKAEQDWIDYYSSLIDYAYEREKERRLLG